MNVTENEKLISQAQMDAMIEGHADYLCSYRVDLSGDECLCGTSKIPEAFIATNGISATELFDIAADRVPGEKERQIYMDCIDRYNLLNAFNSGQKSVSLNHNYDMGGRQMLLTTTINMYKNPLTGNIEGLMYLFDMSHQYVEKKIQSLLIGRQFESIALIKVHTGKFSLMSQFLYLPENMSPATLREVDYVPYVRSVASKFIATEETELYMYNSSLAHLVEKLRMMMHITSQ